MIARLNRPPKCLPSDWFFNRLLASHAQRFLVDWCKFAVIFHSAVVWYYWEANFSRLELYQNFKERYSFSTFFRSYSFKISFV